MKDKSRRNLIKGLAASGGAMAAGTSLPGKWEKPAIESVLLPAHAGTTNVVPDGTWEGILQFEGVDANQSVVSTGAFGQRVVDMLVPPAHACLAGDVPLVLKVTAQIAELSNAAEIGQTSVQGTRIELPEVNIDGQLSNVVGTYDPDESVWDLVVKGLNNGFACQGNDSRGLLILITPTIVTED